MASSKSDVVLLFGGQSPEHSVSCTSASHVYSAIPHDRYNVTLIGIDQSGNWHKCLPPDESIAPKEPFLVSGATISADELFTTSGNTKPIVFPVLHGPNGEDGTIQGLLETFEVPYVGSGVLSSALCMDKIKSKEVLSAHGIPQVSWMSFHADQLASVSETIESSSLEFPLFVKPANMGSSIGVSKVLSTADLDDAIEKAKNYDPWIIVEEFSPGREIEVAILETNSIAISKPGEIVPGADFYSFDDKYEDGATLHIPAELSGSEISTVQSLAEDVFTLMRCKSLARVDFFYEPEGAGWLVNEINTMPGFTPISMYPKLWQEAGISYEDLIVKLLESATR
ncbi:MAG: D-alanine--D-alanine ligase [Acidimicrobiaceae bacterium]|nr:D-alanine--D-alanine ligase [Acidimicrobiaceae bacterium]|tara:strand:+ start:442 stop:1461 length:1020 start_codon:yes stop_codon:yes gene_type:complete